jgi:hypothetical protein
MSKPTIWKVELRPPATDTDEETTRRVRAFLKCALRSFQLTAVTAIKLESGAGHHDHQQSTEVSQ